MSHKAVTWLGLFTGLQLFLQITVSASPTIVGSWQGTGAERGGDPTYAISAEFSESENGKLEGFINRRDTKHVNSMLGCFCDLDGAVTVGVGFDGQ